MTMADEAQRDSRPFEADVAKLLHLMVHAVYSEKDVFLRELISNAADACERLRYEAIANPDLLADDPALRITLLTDTDQRRLIVEDNGIGMSSDEMVEALGTIAAPAPRHSSTGSRPARTARARPSSASSASVSTPPSWSPTGST